MDEINNVSTEMHDDWDDIDFSDITDNAADDWQEAEPQTEEQSEETDTEAESDADHSEETETEAEPEETAAETKNDEEANHSFRLKYMGEEKEFSREETIALAQKGMDYDRIKGRLDEANQLAASNAEMAEFVKSLAQDMNLAPEDFMLEVLAGNLAKKENIGIEEAKRSLKLDRREKALSAKEKAVQDKAEESKAADTKRDKIRAELEEFVKVYPDVKADSIPPEVFKLAVAKQIGLTAAYALHEANEAKAALEAEKQNAQNKALAVGSSSTSGKRRAADEFEAAWYDGT